MPRSFLRSAALRALSSSPSTSIAARPRTFASLKVLPSVSRTSSSTLLLQRRFQSDGLKSTQADGTSEESTLESRHQPETADHAASETTDAAERKQPSSTPDTFASAQQTVQQAGQYVSEATQQTAQSFQNTAQQVGAAAGAAIGQSPFNRPREAASAPTPSTVLYVGNLFFEVNQDILKQEFDRFGTVLNTRIVCDNRGLSKG
jgi:nucleolin